MDTSVSLDLTDLGHPTITHTEPKPDGTKQIMLVDGSPRLYAYVSADQAYDIAAAWFDLATEMRRRWPHLYGTQRFDGVDPLDPPELLDPEHVPAPDLDDPGEFEDYLASLDEVAA